MFDIDCGVVEGRIINNSILLYMKDMCREYGRQLKPICFLNSQLTEKYGCIDLASTLLNIDNQQVPLWYALVSFYKDELGYEFELNLDVVNSIVTDYFLRAGICYIEVKNTKTVKYSIQQQEEKFSAVSAKYLSCKNPLIVGPLEGLPVSVSDGKYSANFDISVDDINECNIPYIKIIDFTESGAKVVKCNKRLDITKIRLSFLPFISSWLQGLYEVLENNLVELKYIKDDNEERTLVTTLNRDILEKVYSGEHVDSMLGSSVLSKEFTNDPVFLPFYGNVIRGWVKLPEVGSSIIEDSGVRAVNYARIVSATIVNLEDVDLTYVRASLNKVIAVFLRRLDECMVKSLVSEVKSIYVGLQNYGFREDLKYQVNAYEGADSIVNALRAFIYKKQYAGTTFKKILHKFMIMNPELFPEYIGIESDKPVSSIKGYGVASMDF